jgi:hypothetical protein
VTKAEQSLDYLRTSRGMPWVELGMKVVIDGKPATVVGGDDSLVIRYDGEKNKRRAHPFWRTQYFAKDGKLIAVDGRQVAS